MLKGIGSGLEGYLTVLSSRQRLVAANIANADTPGYRTKDIDFRSTMSDAMSTSQPATRDVPGLAVKPDGNNVSVDREARLLSENALRFNIAASLLRFELRSVRMAIQEKGQ